jgi:four helix bundle protein
MSERDDLIKRTKVFAVRVLKLVDALPKSASGRAIANQISRSGTSVGANYRAARRGRSKKEFIAKLGIVVEEVDETVYWLELIIETEMLPESKGADLLDEAEQLTRIFAKARKTARD